MPAYTMTQTLFIALAGSCGACARYLIGHFIAQRMGTRFPFGTFFINITGAFAIGFLFSLTTHKLLSPLWQTILATGFLGGYTTFSTMCWESWSLVRDGHLLKSQIYLIGSFLIGLLAALAGVGLGGWFS